MVAAPAIGTVLDTYEIQALLGKGGMSLVYRGFDHNLQRPVAIKILSDVVAHQPGFADRFRQEARLLAGLQHPHIVQVYDFGEQDGYTYMVQELLPGPTLEQRLAELETHGLRLQHQDVVMIITQLASALDAAHAAGVIHRDVKPSNVMWNRHGNLVLTDFGIAKNLFSSAHQTQTGAVIGTPNYLSPEQAQGLPLTPASDIYALGVVAYELITGQVPFSAQTPMSVVLDHIQKPPPPLRQVRPEVPAAVEDVVQRALHKDPAARYASAAAFAQALAKAWTASPGSKTVALDVHARTTSLWGGVPASASPRVAAPPPTPAAVVPPAQPPAAPPARRPRALLPILGGVLGLLFLCGALLAFAGGRRADADTAPTSAPAAAGAPDVQTATPDPPTATPDPPTATALPPTAPPIPPTATAIPPTATAVPPTAVPVGPFDNLRGLLQSAIAGGQVERKKGEELLRDVDEVARELDRDGPARAARKLRDLREKKIPDAVERGEMRVETGQQLLGAIDALIASYGLPADDPGRGNAERAHRDDDDDDDDDD